MTTWITATANYVLLFLLVLYTTASYLSLWIHRWETQLHRGMGICRYLLHGYSFFILLLTAKDYRLLLFYFVQLVFFILADFLQKRFFPYGRKTLYQNMMLLLGTGFLILSRLSFDTAVKQFVLAVAAYGICLLIPFVLRKLPKLESFGLWYTLIGLVFLAAVFVLGSEVFGAKNWLTIKGITFQPSEFVKLSFILAMAALLTCKTKKKYKTLLIASIVAALHLGLLVLCNDFGGALIFFVVYLWMIFVVGADAFIPITAILAGSVAAQLAYQYSYHIKERVLAWQDPFSCIEDEGYQIAQSLFAIANGDWFGAGLLSGMPKTIPVVKSDFIFAAIAEELGAVFAAVLLLVYINSVLSMLILASERKQPFFFAAASGAAALVSVQLFLNVGGVIKLIPSTGVTLPLISLGGSSLCSTIILFQGMQGIQGMEPPKKSRKKGKKRTGCPWRFWAAGTLLLLVLSFTMFYFLFVTLKEAKAVSNNEYNQRITQMEKTMRKGKIKTADGTILAQSIVGEDGSLYRVYPHGAVTSFVTGQMWLGHTGLEYEYRMEQYAIGLDFFEKIKRKANGENIEGNSLVTTINLKLQETAYEALHGYTGAIGVMEIATGKLLALVSTPAYNPNEILAEWGDLKEREDAPFFNRLFDGLYPPGSTFKLVTTLAYLQEHEASEFSYTCTGEARFRNTTVHCYHEEAHGTQSLKQAFANSCNTAYAYMGEQISVQAFSKVAQELGFGMVWPETISYTADSFSLTGQTEDAVFVQTMFGQGETLMTPFHKLMIAAAIANGGVLQLPFLVEKIETCEGDVVESFASAGTLQLMDIDKAKLLAEYMVEASKDKMQRLASKGITVAGKTGTAQHTGSEKDHAWYLCFAPANHPQIAVVVLMENTGTGNQYAVPAAEKVLEVYFEQKMSNFK